MISMFKCGCQLDGRYCDEHRDWGCHNDALPPLEEGDTQHQCPVCFLARLRSVSLSAKATPTRGGRA